MNEIGTRNRFTSFDTRAPGGSQTRSLSGDLGMSKLATASMTFSASTGKVTAANTTFANFAVNDLVLFENTNLNNGYFTVTAIDGTNGAFLTLAPPPKSEGPLSTTVRTA